MKMKYLLLLVFSIPYMLLAQKLEVGVTGGGTSYQGDLVKTTLFTPKEINFGVGPFASYRLDTSFSIRATLLFSNLTGDDQNFAEEPFRKERNAAFESSITEISFVGQWEPFAKKRYTSTEFRNIVSPFVYAGVGLAAVDPTTEYRNPSIDNVAADMLVSDDLSGVQLIIPFGVGLQFDMSEKLAFALDVGARATLTDYLDGISLSGNPDKNDWYVFGGGRLGFRLGNSDKDSDGIADSKDACPEIYGLAALNGCPDADKDGIADKMDECPYTAGSAAFKGCPDTDGDGLVDSKDDCPDVAGSAASRGCPDTDGDGLIDSEDGCPQAAGPADQSGCPDSDGDGIIDKDDACPDKAGLAAKRGCPMVDTDGDGVYDDKDTCPNVKGIARFGGCPDTDGDGIEDKNDRCPRVAGVSANKGCPEIAKEDKETLDLAVKAVRFQTASSVIVKQSFQVLDQIVTIMKKYPNYSMSIAGHTDAQGDAQANQKLSEARAKACHDYLISKGIPAIRLSYAGFGESQPVADNKSAAGRKLNRRVEFKLFIK